ncbi:MAG: hypothetical protein FJW31_17455 [Acidobacteria bacterium]|nr:hypothetical protein [Acidobacteriota bacterium]
MPDSGRPVLAEFLGQKTRPARWRSSPAQAIQVMRIESPALVPAGLQACADNASCQATLRLYPFACPQAAHRALTDWVRCLHCSEKQPPEVDAPLGIGAMIFTLKRALGGLIRVQERREIHECATGVAKAMGERFRAEFRRGRLDPARLADQETERLLELCRTRAMKALGQGTTCNEMKLGAIDAFEWALGERSEKVAPAHLSPTLREALQN